MFENIENLELINILQGTSSIRRLYKNRPSHAFVLRLSGESKYDFDTITLHHIAGEMLFIPKGTSYLVHRIGDDEGRYVLINFNALIPNPTPRLYPLGNFMNINHVGSLLAKRWLFRTTFDVYQCTSVFYEILAYTVACDKTKYLGKSEILKPAITYLENHIFDSNLKIDDLHLLCGISDTYFRKHFVAQFKTTPQNYVINKRLTQAKAIIDNEDYNNFYEVAHSVGYDDPLYFSRAFKKKYGVAPSENTALYEAER